MYNVSPLLYKRFSNDRFINKISITDEQDKMLREARKKVRQAIRTAFSEARDYLQNESVRNDDIEWISKIKPKFFTQGSYAYKTLNSPCYDSQEIDLDDGVYLPMSILNSEPSANIEWFFKIVDGALKKLARQEGWKFKEKPTCARVIIPGKQTHIDVPLYAIPDDRHTELVEALNYAKLDSRTLNDIYFSDAITQSFFLLNEDEVNLATRDEGWKKSDPMKISDWFKMEKSVRGQTSGERLIRVCRFLKAWRDFIWEDGGPSSLALMICAVEAYPKDDNNRDDYALLQVAKKLPALLGGTINNPAAKDEVVYPRGNINQEEIILKARALVTSLEMALSGSLNKHTILSELKSKFGQRIPTIINWIEEITSAAIVRSTAAMNIKPESIPNTKSG